MKEWVFRKSGDDSPPEGLSGELDVTPRFLELLWNRGLKNPSDIENYLSPSASKLTNPRLWPQIPEAAKAVADSLIAGKSLAVWGDYDVDGITATALVLDILEFHGFRPLHHLPDRRSEGYGLNAAGIEELAEQGCQVLLTVDCGISDYEAVQRANELGIKVIVSDHHLPPARLPSADRIINPRMESAGSWPCANLAGVGVAFYLMAEVNRLLEASTGRRYKMAKALDLVALGTLADIMAVEGENRILIHAGLKRMQKPARPGLLALKSVSGLDSSSKLSSDQAVFQLAPRLNAAGRMGDPGLGLELLRAENARTAAELADELDARNRERKSLQNKMFEEARAQADKLLQEEGLEALVLYEPDWHPGIIGIIAAKIVEEYNRPAFALCKDGETLKGSGRTLEGIDLHLALEQCASSLDSFGGHKKAAGARIKPSCLPAFRKSFNQAVKRQMKSGAWSDRLWLDGELDFTEARDNVFLEELSLMEPFGPGNPEPVFLSPELRVKSRRFLGNRTDSVILELEDSSRSKEKPILMKAKIWRRADKFPPSMENSVIRIAYTPRKTEYNSIPTYEAVIKDWRMVKKAEGGRSYPPDGPGSAPLSPPPFPRGPVST